MKTNPIISCIAPILSLLLILCGCNNTDIPDADTSEQTTAESETQPEAKALEIIKDGESAFKIIRTDEAIGPIITDMNTFKKRVKSRTGVSLDCDTDWVRADTDTSAFNEILIGETTRPESVSFIESLPEHGYGYLVTENKLVIAGKNVNMTAYALILFENSILYNSEYVSDGKFTLPVGLTEVMVAEKADTLDGILNSSYSVEAYTEDLLCISRYQEFLYAQGAATDGTYYYVALLKKDGDTQTDVIVKVKIGEKTPVMRSEELQLYHANDMCYNPDEGMLVIVNTTGKKISYVDPDTLKLVKTVEPQSIPSTPWAIAYNQTEKTYVMLAGSEVMIYSTDFTFKRSMSYHSASNYVGQGMDCDGKYIFVPMSPDSSAGTYDNIIDIYDWSSGFKRTVHLNRQTESETMMNYNGKYYMSFNSNGGIISEIHYAVVYT